MVFRRAPTAARRVCQSCRVEWGKAGAVRRRVMRGRRPHSSLDGVTQGLITVALVWQALWVLSQSQLWPTEQPTPATTTVMWLLIGAWATLAVAHGSGRYVASGVRVNVVLLVVAVVVLNWTQVRSTAPDWQVVAELAALAAGASALLVSFRWGLGITLGLSALFVRDVLVATGAESPRPSVGLVLNLSYVLAIGLSSVAVTRVLKRDAAAADEAADDLIAIERQRLTTEQVERELRMTERMLHETVLNTLVAIARGGLAGSTALGQALRERCVEAARLLSFLRGRSTAMDITVPSTGDLARDLADMDADLRAAGVAVTWHGSSLGEVPREPYLALRTAVAEALSNARRHADASTCSVVARVSRRSGRLRVRIVVRDDGRGFDPQGRSHGFGLTEAIRRPLVEVGGTAEITSEPEAGTSVVLEWRQRNDHRYSLSTVSPASLAIPVLSALGLYATVLLIATGDSYPSTARNIGAFALFITGAVLVGVRTLRGRLPWPVVLTVAALGWIVYALQSSATASPGSVNGWASPAVAALFMVTAATGPRWGWLALVGSWMAFQGDPLHEITQPGTVIILVGALLGRSTRRNTRLAWDRRLEQASQAAVAQVSQDRVDRLSARYEPLVHSHAQDLLEGIASGQVKAEDPRVTSAAALEERFIRNVMLCDPDADPIHALASRLTLTAHGRGVLLDLDLTDRTVPEVAIGAPAVTSFLWAVNHAAPARFEGGQGLGSTARFSSRVEGQGELGEVMVLRLLTPLSNDAPASGAAPAQAGALLDPEDLAGSLWLWEATIPLSAPAAPAAPAASAGETVR